MTRLEELAIARLNLFRKLAPNLRRVNPRNPNRAQIEKQRTATRRKLKKEIEKNAADIIAEVFKSIDHRRGPAWLTTRMSK